MLIGSASADQKNPARRRCERPESSDARHKSDARGTGVIHSAAYTNAMPNVPPAQLAVK
jgi:hypothetical protein